MECLESQCMTNRILPTISLLYVLTSVQSLSDAHLVKYSTNNWDFQNTKSNQLWPLNNLEITTVQLIPHIWHILPFEGAFTDQKSLRRSYVMCPKKRWTAFFYNPSGNSRVIKTKTPHATSRFKKVPNDLKLWYHKRQSKWNPMQSAMAWNYDPNALCAELT